MTTSADVARAAGVSRATVSYVLNDAPGRSLSPETRETVLRVARELGYQPNALARSLKRGRSNTVLFPMSGVPMNSVLTALFSACTDALAPRGLSLVLDMSHYEDRAAQAAAWAGMAPAAVLDLVVHHDDPALELLRARGVRVLATSAAGESSFESSGDQFALEQRVAQVRYLTGLGHKRLRWVVPPGPTAPVDPRTTRRLLSSVRKAAAAGGARLVIDECELTEIADLAGSWDPLPDAVLTHNDTYAMGVLTALQQRGVRVPEDVAVMGADDEPAARAVTPALTTVAGDFREFAEAIADAVEATLAGRKPRPLPVPGVRIIERAST
jgi:DNA-binding LacI/PurR family transcriptional regulator